MGSIKRLFTGSDMFWFALAIPLSLLFSLSVVGASGDSQDFSALRDQLERLGWRVARSPAGDLLLWPPGEQPGSLPVAVAKKAEAARARPIAVTDIESLRTRLSDQGWDVRQSGDGSLLLYPDSARIGARVPQLSTTEEKDRFEEVRALLGASGWRVVRDRNGTLTLYPQVGSPVDPQHNAVLQVESTDLDQVRGALIAAGWRLEEEPDGTLILHPDAGAARQGERSTLQGVRGLLVDPVASGAIQLPVDSWGKAHRIAGFWLEQQSRKDLVVGKIRKVNWVYLVSIVENSKPFRLHNQLAIRNRDGRVIPLF